MSMRSCRNAVWVDVLLAMLIVLGCGVKKTPAVTPNDGAFPDQANVQVPDAPPNIPDAEADGALVLPPVGEVCSDTGQVVAGPLGWHVYACANATFNVASPSNPQGSYIGSGNTDEPRVYWLAASGSDQDYSVVYVIPPDGFVGDVESLLDEVLADIDPNFALVSSTIRARQPCEDFSATINSASSTGIIQGLVCALMNAIFIQVVSADGGTVDIPAASVFLDSLVVKATLQTIPAAQTPVQSQNPVSDLQTERSKLSTADLCIADLVKSCTDRCLLRATMAGLACDLDPDPITRKACKLAASAAAALCPRECRTEQCPSGQWCYDGVCCPTGVTACGTTCCGDGCSHCEYGQCVSSCKHQGEECTSCDGLGLPPVLFGGTCTNDCFNPCSPICKDGACTPTADCDPGNCKTCSVGDGPLPRNKYFAVCADMCRSDQVCNDRMCTCPSGQTNCGGTCVDLQTNSNNCGGCGNVCPTNELCFAGQCGGCPNGSPPPGFKCCVDPARPETPLYYDPAVLKCCKNMFGGLFPMNPKTCQ